jgi:hypothetical protein
MAQVENPIATVRTNMGTSVEARLTYLWETPKTLHGWFATVDHKQLGARYLITAFIFLAVGGLEALPYAHPAFARGHDTLLTRDLQSDIHHARRDHDLLVCVANSLQASPSTLFHS